MKLQNLTVIFAIIIIPIILIVSLYISTGIKTIKYQSLYDTGLLTATHDAIYAFEQNTANDKYSDNPERKRDILKSSIKMFETSLANACGISSYNADGIEEYVPAIVFGMYDGFYMYAPSYNTQTGKYEHGLKNYVYYSETLDDGTVIRYSLDNYVVVYGDFGNGYEINEGYLIDLEGSEEDGSEYKGIDIVEENINGKNADGIKYYKEAFEFTNWFNNSVANKADYLNIDKENDPEDEDSAFSQHKRTVIKQKMESVLNSSITAYSERTWGYNYKMPKLSDEDWDKIYSNISMVTFFQGKNIGLTKYNGYCVLNSTNSNEYVNSNLMYFIDESGTYHDIRCEKCIEAVNNGKTLTGYKIGAFEKKKVQQEVEKKDEEGNIIYVSEGVPETEIVDIYEYEHEELACYYCVNGSIDIEQTINEYIDSASPKIQTAYWTSLARERYNTTKLTNTTGISNATEINIEVIWEDQNSEDRPEKIDLELLKDGEKDREITITESGGWKTTIENLEVYKNGAKIIYTLQGYDNINKYEVTLTGEDNTWIITYKRIPEVDKKVTIKFDDNNNQDGIRPQNIEIQLCKNWEESGESVALSSSNNWKHTWSNLPERENGKDIKYTVDGQTISGYSMSWTEENNEFIITYKHTPEVITKTISILWDDESNKYGIRPGSVVVELYNGNTITLYKDNFESIINLPKFKDGKEIEYTEDTIKEIAPIGYEVEVSYNQNQDTFIITSKLNTVIAKWVQDGVNVYGRNKDNINLITLKVGDYINYKCYTDVPESKLTYTAYPYRSGYSSNQVFKVTEDIKWRLLGVDNGLLIITSSKGQEFYKVNGKTAYTNGVSELNNISKIYGYGSCAVEARHITLADINRVTGQDLYAYGYDVSSFLSTRLPLFGAGYWIATSWSEANSTYGLYYCAWHFGIRRYTVYANGSDYFQSCNIRPVVYLKSDVQLEKQSDGSYNIK